MTIFVSQNEMQTTPGRCFKTFNNIKKHIKHLKTFKTLKTLKKTNEKHIKHLKNIEHIFRILTTFVSQNEMQTTTREMLYPNPTVSHKISKITFFLHFKISLYPNPTVNHKI